MNIDRAEIADLGDTIASLDKQMKDARKHLFNILRALSTEVWIQQQIELNQKVYPDTWEEELAKYSADFDFDMSPPDPEVLQLAKDIDELNDRIMVKVSTGYSSDLKGPTLALLKNLLD